MGTEAMLFDGLEEATIDDLQRGMDAGVVSSKELVLQYIQRIAALDKNGPRLNAVLEINPDALVIAEAMDRERAVRGPRGPLHGIPVLLKDNIETGDRMHTSAGALALADSYAPRDAFVAGKLRQAGAVLLGKANMSELAKFVSLRMPNGYSSRGGVVRNPYGPGLFDVGGSSSGSAAAVSANLTAVALGTETLGSIINPSVENSIVGLNPTIGLVSRDGLVPLAPTHDTVGPMTRTVADAAALLGAIAGFDERDDATRIGLGRAVADFRPYLREDGLRGARIGIPKNAHYPDLRGEEKRLLERELGVIEKLGAVLVEIEDLSRLERQEWDLTVLIYEFKPAFNHYLSRLGPHVPVHSLKDLIAFNRMHNPGVALYGQHLLIEAERTSGTLTEPEYILTKMRDLENSRRSGIDAFVEKYRLDAILSPGHTGVAAPAKAGYPSITVPAGYRADGKPFGLTFTSRAFSEPTLFRIAYAYEQATMHRKSPVFDDKQQ
ncbi:amidase family protein [Paenibacillus sp.]|uniref:amidase family protein n=1 Tax=Paenibacillus sp. TaxID=58172 RepID=UPI002D2BD0F2|nr:amidase family protein [Paenibacillus sp.]HZG86617.1 amidase family protein [Paenibacillus sp.]